MATPRIFLRSSLFGLLGLVGILAPEIASAAGQQNASNPTMESYIGLMGDGSLESGGLFQINLTAGGVGSASVKFAAQCRQCGGEFFSKA